ncbi:MAG: hypothetical protein CFE29_25285 [Bradyrhizobiaceae bacterium PARB1]|jgi:hypothetical protein|nr:MAG: hypothetical protein CFE29_25285 [Bradyrhizobiaceae bacterium PARB1]
MKSLRFENIWLLSKKEERARKVKFETTNLIVGMNHTGKSSLIKSLFVTLGAAPEGNLADWDKDAVTLVEFSVDGVTFKVVHQNGCRAIFDSDGSLLASAVNHANWTSIFADVSNFNLVLPEKKTDAVVKADARCFFLPFYINQDGSWLSGWDTFVGLQQYKTPVGAILDYFTGVKPPEWYQVNSEKALVQRDLDAHRQEHALVSRFRERFSKTMSLSGPKFDSQIFDQDISRLVQEVSELNSEQEKLRDVAVRERETANSALLQANLAIHALAVYDNDSSYLRDIEHDDLVCPTCGAEHDKSFMAMLNYAEDARVLRQLAVRLKVDARNANNQYEETKKKVRDLESRYASVSNLLSTRRGDLEFGDVVRSMGAEAAFAMFEKDLDALKGDIDACLIQIDEFDQQLKELTNAKRSKEILKLFRASYAAAMTALSTSAANAEKARLTSKPNVSGSGGPRTILAYYSALWRTCFGQYGSYSVPLVIDSPQQQGQDVENLPRMIRYIAKDMPSGAQVILGVETPTSEKFDQVIELSEPYRLLETKAFAEVDSVVLPYLDKMHLSLLST